MEYNVQAIINSNVDILKENFQQVEDKVLEVQNAFNSLKECEDIIVELGQNININLPQPLEKVEQVASKTFINIKNKVTSVSDKIVSEFSSKVGPSAIAAFAKVELQFNKLQEVPAKISKVSAEMKNMRTGFDNIKTTVQSLNLKNANQSWETMAKNFREICSSGSNVKQTFSGLVGDLKQCGGAVIDLGKNINVKIPKPLQEIGNKGKKVFDNLKTKVSSVADKTVNEFSTKVGPAAKEAFGKVGTEIDKLKKAPQELDKMGKGLKGMKDGFGNVKTAIQNFDLKNPIQSCKNIGDGFKGVAENGKNVKDSFKNLSGMVKNFKLKDIVKSFKNLGKSIKNTTLAQKLFNLATKMNPIGILVAIITTLVVTLVALYKNNDKVRKFIDKCWKGIKNSISTVIKVIKTVITTVWNAIKTATMLVFNGIKLYFTVVFTVIKTVIMTVVNVIKTVITTVWNTIKTVTTTVFGAIKNFFSSVFNGIKSIISGAVNTVKTIITAIWNTIKSVTSTVFGGIKNTISNIFDKIASIVGNIKDTIISGFKGAVEFITSLPGKALEWGKDMIMGIVDGIKGAIHYVTDAVKGVANKITGFLHFSVPDEGPLTEYESWMPDFMQGLASGIESNKNLITDAVKGISADMSLGVTGIVGQTQTATNIDSMRGSTVSKVSGGTNIYFNGKYSFENKNDINYFMNKAAVLVQRRRG